MRTWHSVQWYTNIITTATHDHHHVVGFLPLLQEYLNVSQNCVLNTCPSYAFIQTHTHVWHTEYLHQQYEWEILDHAPYRFDWAFNSQHFSHDETKQCVKGLRCRDRRVSVHKTIVLEKEKYTKKNMYKHYPTQHIANWWKIQGLFFFSTSDGL